MVLDSKETLYILTSMVTCMEQVKMYKVSFKYEDYLQK